MLTCRRSGRQDNVSSKKDSSLELSFNGETMLAFSFRHWSAARCLEVMAIAPSILGVRHFLPEEVLQIGELQ